MLSRRTMTATSMALSCCACTVSLLIPRSPTNDLQGVPAPTRPQLVAPPRPTPSPTTTTTSVLPTVTPTAPSKPQMKVTTTPTPKNTRKPALESPQPSSAPTTPTSAPILSTKVVKVSQKATSSPTMAQTSSTSQKTTQASTRSSSAPTQTERTKRPVTVQKKTARTSTPTTRPEPQNNAVTVSQTRLQAGSESTRVYTVSGNGIIPITYLLSSGSAAPQVPVYTLVLCDGTKVYSGAFNPLRGEPTTKNIPFAGDTCNIKVQVAQPSKKWAGTTSTVTVKIGQPTKSSGGTRSVTSIPWTSQPVTGTRTFSYGNQSGLTGTITIKMTTCSSMGGTTDSTRSYGCTGLIQKDTSSTVYLKFFDNAGTLLEQRQFVSWRTHHDTISFQTPRKLDGILKVTVTHINGAAMLVHGPGSGVVGTK